MNVLYFAFSAVLIVLSTTALLIEKFDYKKILILILYVFVMSYVAFYYGAIIGIPTMAGVIILIIILSEKYKLENACISCIGYLINITCNNVWCLCAVALFRMPLVEFESRYWLPFCSMYLVFLMIIMKGLRCIIYDKLHLVTHLNNISVSIRNGLFANMFLYLVIFYVTISLGQNAGYSENALLLNCTLFAICMCVSGFLIWVCASGVKSAEQKKADLRQKEITENYINSMEHVLDELRAFKHDYRNIMAEMSGYMREEQYDELKAYYYKVTQTEEKDRNKELYIWKNLRNIQPMELKGLLYEKILGLINKSINIEVRIEDDLCVSYEEIQTINRILGIFIDNAMEAALETEEKYVRIDAYNIEHGTTVEVANTFKEIPNLAKMYQKGYSTKGQGRGTGLYWVWRTLKEKDELSLETDIRDVILIQKLNILIK